MDVGFRLCFQQGVEKLASRRVDTRSRPLTLFHDYFPRRELLRFVPTDLTERPFRNA